jgi:ribose 5-phosphate isomerase A
MNLDEEKQLASELAAELVEDGMRVGLGTGSTVAHLLSALARRAPKAVFVATSPHTEQRARFLGLDVLAFDSFDHLDLAIDGADQIGADGWLVKGGGGAHTREKIVAASAERFVVIADSSKRVAKLHPPVPLELSMFALSSTLRRLGTTRLRDAAPSPDGGVIADYYGAIDDPVALAECLAATPGVIDHGLFEPQLVAQVIYGSSRPTTHFDLGGNS